MTDIDELADDFELLEDWEDRYRHLVELGERLPPPGPGLRTEALKVQGCVSDVWVRLRPVPDRPGRLELEADSNTAIIKGVVALLVALCRDKDAAQILETDFDRLFERLALAEHLSPSRHVGIYSIVDKIYAQARALLSEAA